MATSSEFEALQSAISQALVQTTRSAANISREDIQFHCSSNSQVRTLLSERSKILLQLTERLIRQSSDDFRGRLTDAEDLDLNFRSIVDVTDNLLERVDVCLDEFKGLFKRAEPADGKEANPTAKRPRLSRNLQDQNIIKPQLAFDQPPSNNETEPFRPLLNEKPHAIISLENSLRLEKNADKQDQFLHPYLHEIEDFKWPERVYQHSPAIQYRPFETTSATFVDDMDGVLAMLQQLRNAEEIAIDLEHHDRHSYVGIVCLMQISTRDKDWIIDTLQPWRRQLQVLNEVFANPGIVKVLHGATMDAIWLQRDLGLYLVGLFDTFHASRSLGYPRASLAFLLEKFVGYAAQKQYQTADWRVRPLPPEMFDYARSDTHFLLYIYDCMKNELIEKSNTRIAEQDKLNDVLINSKREALQRYEHPFYRDEVVTRGNSWSSALLRRAMNLSQEQIAVFARLHRWRDQKARELDENTLQVMSNGVLESIARFMPSDEPALLGVSHPVSSAVRENIKSLVRLIAAARRDASMIPNPFETISNSKEQLPERAPLGYPTGSSKHSEELESMRSFSSSLWGSAAPLSVRVAENNEQMIRITRQLAPASATPDLKIEDTCNGQGQNEAKASYVPSTRTAINKNASNDQSSNNLSNDPVSRDENTVEMVQKRSHRKAKKKSHMRETKTSEVNGQVPHNYDDASSMLTTTSSASRYSAGVNPFGKSADAQTGLKKQHNQSTKSGTFK